MSIEGRVNPEGLPLTEGQFINSYNEFRPGQELSFAIKTVNPDGSVSVVPKTITIEAVKGGGFFGKVIIPKDEPFVIKTSLPDPWHHFLRLKVWGDKELPARVNETDAQLEHLATKIIHNTVSAFSGGEFYSPDSLGYTMLTTGFAQIVEKVEGRPPRLDGSNNDVAEFRNAQKKLTELGYRLGFEQVGQIHFNNPFGMANVWFDEKKQKFVWLDTIPAIPHTDFLKPFFRYRFYGDIKKRLGNGEVTFNKIHTALLLNEISGNAQLFQEDVLENLIGDIKTYTQLLKDRQQTRINKQNAKDAWSEVIKNLKDGAVNFMPSKFADIRKLFQDPNYRLEFFMSGPTEARNQGVITRDEFDEGKRRVKALLENDKTKVFPTLFLWYIASGQAINALELLTYGYAFLGAEDKMLTAAIGILIGRGIPFALNPLSTLGVGKLMERDLKKAAAFSMIPIFGPLLAIPAQMRKDLGSDIVWDTTKRNVIANVSKLNPAGGWGTQPEASLWETLENFEQFWRDEEGQVFKV